ncbi:hypothetical protein C4J81_06105 [Deltaproteobacteria bacterium Smac51]|nr:hypothetical protein C4J81_06105 [Deltaproteobacteria bacterium Smac51]
MSLQITSQYSGNQAVGMSQSNKGYGVGGVNTEKEWREIEKKLLWSEADEKRIAQEQALAKAQAKEKQYESLPQSVKDLVDTGQMTRDEVFSAIECDFCYSHGHFDPITKEPVVDEWDVSKISEEELPGWLEKIIKFESDYDILSSGTISDKLLNRMKLKGLITGEENVEHRIKEIKRLKAEMAQPTPLGEDCSSESEMCLIKMQYLLLNDEKAYPGGNSAQERYSEAYDRMLDKAAPEVEEAWNETVAETGYNPLIDEDGKIVKSSMFLRYIEMKHSLKNQFGPQEASDRMDNSFTTRESARAMVKSALDWLTHPSSNYSIKPDMAEQMAMEKKFYETFLALC